MILSVDNSDILNKNLSPEFIRFTLENNMMKLSIATISILTGLLFQSDLYAWTNSRTIILETKRANIQDSTPKIRCGSDTLNNEIIKQNSNTWQVFYDMPKSLKNCYLSFTYKFGEKNPCVYNGGFEFRVWPTNAQQGGEWDMYGVGHARLDSTSEPFAYCPGKVYIWANEGENTSTLDLS